MERIGVLGGTFDPPHIGHLWLAELAWQQLDLDTVLFLPAGKPPHKLHYQLSAAHDRLAMTCLATTGNRRLQVDDLDIKRPLPHYTLTLFHLLHERFPLATFWLLIGSDSLRDLPTWYKPGDILQLTRLGMLPRPGVILDWVALSQSVPGVDGQLDVLDGPTIDISSTAIRHWIANGRSLRYLVPANVMDYIKTEKMYGRFESAITNDD